MNRLKDKGRILESRAYGDWGRYARFKQSLLEAGVQMHELTSYRGQDKNRADIALVVDAMELAFTRDFIHTYVILSGDSDFTPLVMRLRSMNKRVIGIGTRGSTSGLLIAACDEFIFYESMRKQNEPQSRSRNEQAKNKGDSDADTEDDSADSLSLTKEQAFELLVQTLEGLQKDDPQPVLAGLVKQSMQRKAPSFNESDYGFSVFARFLEAARDKKLIGIARAERAGGYNVFEVGSAPPEEDTSDEDSVDALPALTGEAADFRAVLKNLGVNPLTHMMRHTVVHEFVDHVQDRTRKKRKNTLKYSVGDTARRCRKADPPVPPRYIRAIINALAQAGALLHADGNPVRSASAPFTVENEPEELLGLLLDFYLTTLRSHGMDISNGNTLSSLFYGDDEHADEISSRVQQLPVPETPAPPSVENDPDTEQTEASPTSTSESDDPKDAEQPE
jgi:hypothetical protein